MTLDLLKLRIFESHPMIIVDAGALGGAEPHWLLYEGQAKVFGFEPNQAECDRLNRRHSRTPQRYFPLALAEHDGRRTFYERPFAPASGFFKYDAEFVKRFPDSINVEGGNPSEMEVARVDSLVERGDIPSPEFMKIDVQGGELAVLKGAEKSLRKTVLGLNVEVTFDRWYEDAPTFCDISSYLKTLGLELYGLTPYKMARKVFRNQYPGALRTGQVIWGEALFFRDGVRELEPGGNGTAKLGWDDLRILKLASLMEVFDLPDCAVELLRGAVEVGLLKGLDVNRLAELLVEDIGYKPQYSPVVQGMAASVFRAMPPPLRNAARRMALRVRDIAEGLLRL